MSESALLAPGADAPHAVGEDQLWSESWYFDFSDDAGRGGFLRLTTNPAERVAWLWAAYVDGADSVMVRDHAVPLPRGGGLEVRASGLWADLTCEAPMAHWTIGLEAFGLVFDDPAEAFGAERGDRVPLGLDLEWEALEPPFEYPRPAGREGSGHFQHAGRVHGEVLVGTQRIDIDGWGQRDRFWGPRDWWDVGWHWAAFRLGGTETVSVARPDRGGLEHATGYQSVDGEEPHPLLRAGVDTTWGDDGFPSRVDYELEGGRTMVATVLSLAPVVIPRPGGSERSRLTRALCRFTNERGDVGTGWAEWLRPPSADEV